MIGIFEVSYGLCTTFSYTQGWFEARGIGGCKNHLDRFGPSWSLMSIDDFSPLIDHFLVTFGCKTIGFCLFDYKINRNV